MKNILAAFFVFAFLLTACAPASPQSTPRSEIEISQASIRLLGGDMPAAGYMLIKNTGALDDRLVNARADFAEQLMLHQSSVDSNGVASMKMVMAIDVPAGQTTELKPGSFHIVFEGLKPTLKVGDTVTLTLQFEQAGAVRVQARLTQ